MDNKRYRLLMVWNNPFHLDLFESVHESFEAILASVKNLQSLDVGQYKLYYLEWTNGDLDSVTLGTFSNGSWPALNDAIKAMEEHNKLHPSNCTCILCAKLMKEEFTEFKPYEPLPVDEEGDSYFPPSEGILVANLEVRLPNERRLQLDETSDGPPGSKKEI